MLMKKHTKKKLFNNNLFEVTDPDADEVHSEANPVNVSVNEDDFVGVKNRFNFSVVAVYISRT